MMRFLLMPLLACHQPSYPLGHRARYLPWDQSCYQLGHQPAYQTTARAAVRADCRIDGRIDRRAGHAAAQTAQQFMTCLRVFFAEQFRGRR
ncbi:hypothetical protein HNQ38_000374 [Desulfovibrio intestinalis]|uniref:Uncharacterized protein n=1 Tax=Desulfovibrio intestinalis TaxID=58621 RepID=A0A7W8FEY9_9BACT|nr:hypothetical protein [Desulfovibrio intestinalis]